MSGPEAKNPAPAGISAPDDLDVADLFERLREELRRGAGAGEGADSEFAATRALAERFWPVTAERDAGGGPKGLVTRFLRKEASGIENYVDELSEHSPFKQADTSAE